MCSKPVPAMSAYEPTSCLSLCVISMASSTARTFASIGTDHASFGKVTVMDGAKSSASVSSARAAVDLPHAAGPMTEMRVGR